MRHVRLSSLLAAAAVVVALAGVQPATAEPVGRSSVSVTGLDPDGVTPERVGQTTRVIAGSYGNFLAFTFTQGASRLSRGTDALSIDIPAAWGGSSWEEPEFSADPERYETPGFVRVKQGSCASPGTLSVVPGRSGAGSTIELAGFSCAARESLSIELFYVTAPATAGSYDFPTQLAGRPVRDKDRPALAVHPVPDVALVLSEVPPSVQVGQAFDVVLTAVDDNGRVAHGYRGTVRFVAGCEDLGPFDYTFTAEDRGSHRMSGIVLREPGERTIGFRDVGNLARQGEARTTATGEPDGPSGCGVHYH